jgi:hypothetical protein
MARAMGRWRGLGGLGLLGLGGLVGLGAACTPDIQSQVYVCGPSEFCPPDLACDPSSNLCVLPDMVQPFQCTASGTPLPVIGCGSTASTGGCVDGAAHTHHAIEVPAGCTTMVSATAQFPGSLMPLAMTVHDPAQAVVATSAPCGTSGGGQAATCVMFAATGGQTYDLDVGAAAPVSDCGGACAFNQYVLSVTLLPP